MKSLLALLLTLLALPAAAQDAPAGPPSGVIERAVMLGEGIWAVPAVITLPTDKRKVPAVALLHGFGPGTLDADVGPNKIFRETAWALAQRGVASVRHAKRTTAHRDLFRQRGSHATVAEEWIDDARAAVAALRDQPEIDTARIYVAGHSASGAMVARIARDGGLAGAILVSGGATRFQTTGAMIVDQARYVESLNPGDPAAAEGARKTAAEARRIDDPAEKNDAEVLRHPLWYWRSLAAFDPVADIGALTANGGRVLIVQGGRDYLVGPLQWEGWAKTFGDNPAVTRRLLPDLNHMMQAGSGKMRPEEYGERRPIAAAFTDLLANWVKGK